MKLGLQRLFRLKWLGLAALGAAVVGACATVGTTVTSKEWKSRATPQSPSDKAAAMSRMVLSISYLLLGRTGPE